MSALVSVLSIAVTGTRVILRTARSTAHHHSMSPTKMCLVAQITSVKLMAMIIPGATLTTMTTGITAESKIGYPVNRELFVTETDSAENIVRPNNNIRDEAVDLINQWENYLTL